MCCAWLHGTDHSSSYQLERCMGMFKRSNTSAKGFDWAGLGWLFLFFWYFSGITQLLIQLTGTSGFSGFRQAFVMSAIWLAKN